MVNIEIYDDIIFNTFQTFLLFTTRCRICNINHYINKLHAVYNKDNRYHKMRLKQYNQCLYQDTNISYMDFITPTMKFISSDIHSGKHHDIAFLKSTAMTDMINI